jgi:hypothetical protein
VDPEGETSFFLDELEAVMTEWVAVVYHHRHHAGLINPGLPGLKQSPAAMLEHGTARAEHIGAPGIRFRIPEAAAHEYPRESLTQVQVNPRRS